MHGAIAGIEYYLPERTLTTEELSRRFPEWNVQKIDRKTGIACRHVAAPAECASDLAVHAARKLFDSGVCSPADVDFLLLCTQSPDYALPTTACLLQDRLGIPSSAGALDFNLGCSGFVYGLGLAEGLIASGQTGSLLLLTAETYSKYIADDDRNCLTIFGDGAAATLVVAQPGDRVWIGPFVYGTDGRGGERLIVPNSGSRRTPERRDECSPPLFMDGEAIFNFTLEEVPRAVRALLAKAGLCLEDIDLFVFHQANAYMLGELRRILKIPADRFQITLDFCANTVSSTLPIALKAARCQGRLHDGSRVMLVGFGVGLSWAATIVTWTDNRSHQPAQR
jgi:3-oxoacyl-[acyl-carrier-protein] synthase III